MKKETDIKKYNPKESKEEFFSSTYFPDSSNALLKELTQDIIPKCSDPKHPEHELAKKKFGDKSLLLFRIFENDSHVGLMESFDERYRMFSSEMSKTMISEFNCSNEAEKALVELIVNAYIRVIDNSRRLNNELEGKNITHNRNVYIGNLSKQVDRANRQFLNALIALKQLKEPQLNIKVKTDNAYFAQNQQINNKEESLKPNDLGK